MENVNCSKTSLQSFLYDLINVFISRWCCYRDLQKNDIQKYFSFQNLTFADSNSIFFIFICKFSCSVNEKTAKYITFEVLTKSKVLNRLDLFENFWEQFNVQNKSLKKQVVCMK